MTRRLLRYAYPAVALVIVLAGGAISAIEADVVESFGSGVWWALSLVTTVGFAGHPPTTTAGRVLAGALMITGFGLLSLTSAALASLFVRQDEAPSQQRDIAFEAEALAELRALRARLDELQAVAPQ